MVANKLLLNISFFMGVFGDDKCNMLNKLEFIGDIDLVMQPCRGRCLHRPVP